MKCIATCLITATFLATTCLADGVMSLAGSEWGDGTTKAPFEVMVKFEPDGKVWGRLGCNRFTGTYTQDGMMLSFGALATTRMMCPDDAMKTETLLSAAIAATRQADISHLKLVLRDANGTALASLQRRDFD